MNGDWQAVADAIKAELRRRQWTQEELARHAGAGTKTINTLVSGRPRARMPTVAPQIEDAFGWKTGTLRNILLHGSTARLNMTPAEFRTLLDLMRERLDRASFAADDRDRLRARIDELEADIEGTAGEHRAS